MKYTFGGLIPILCLRPQPNFMSRPTHRCDMAKTETVRVYKEDKKRINEMAEARDAKNADVVADLLREPVFRCPECGEPFDPSEVDPETVRERGMMSNRVDKLLKGEREVKDFECTTCEGRVKPEDVEAAPAEKGDGATADEMGVTAQNEKGEFSTKEA